eukprot:snap_masked-scaffold_13-processed-gene-9.23-mRNA-1 protein AED:1.00 eAED:1.00 QI:0/-1/0/0/-1/1/1/0/60
MCIVLNCSETVRAEEIQEQKKEKKKNKENGEAVLRCKTIYWYKELTAFGNFAIEFRKVPE